MWVQSVQVVQVVPALWRAHWWQVVRLFGVVLPFVVCSLLLSVLSLCLWCVACKYGSISRF